MNLLDYIGVDFADIKIIVHNLNPCINPVLLEISNDLQGQ
jgi:hypothetical protein